MSLLKISSYFLSKDNVSNALQISGIIRFILVFIQGVLLVKLSVPTVTIGIVEFIFLILAFSRFFLESGGKKSSFTYKKTKSTLKNNFAAHQILGIIAAAIVIPVFYFSQQTDIAQSFEFKHIIYLIFISLFAVPSDLFDWILLEVKKSTSVIWHTFIIYFVQLLLVVYALAYKNDILLLLQLLTAFYLCRWIIVLLIVIRNDKSKLDFNTIKPWLLWCIPLILQAFIAGLMTFVDSWVVTIYEDETQFAYFRYGARNFPLFSLIIAGLVNGILFKTNNKIVDSAALKKDMQQLMNKMLPWICLLLLASPFLFKNVYNDEFQISARYFNIYLITIIFHVVINQVYFYAKGLNWLLLYVGIIEVLVNIVLSVILYKAIGMIGIPIATFFAFMLHRIVLSIRLNSLLPKNERGYYPTKTHAIFTALVLSSFLLSDYIYFW